MSVSIQPSDALPDNQGQASSLALINCLLLACIMSAAALAPAASDQAWRA